MRKLLAASSITGLVLHPDLLVVVLEAEVELTNHAGATLQLVSLRENLDDEVRDELDQLVEVHARPPLPFTFADFIVIIFIKATCIDLSLLSCSVIPRNNVIQQVSAISESRLTELKILVLRLKILTVVLVMMIGG